MLELSSIVTRGDSELDAGVLKLRESDNHGSHAKDLPEKTSSPFRECRGSNVRAILILPLSKSPLKSPTHVAERRKPPGFALEDADRTARAGPLPFQQAVNPCRRADNCK